MKSALRLGAFVILAIGSGSIAFSQSGDSSNIFSAPQNAPQPTNQAVEPPSALDALEFNGTMTMGGVTRVSVYDTKAQRNYWLADGELHESGYKMVRLKEDNDAVVISKGGVSRTLAMKKVKIDPLKIAPMAQNAPDRPVDPSSTPMSNVSVDKKESDDEVRARMQRVAEEIRRRRAERRSRIEESRQNSNN